jgi:hypothetical protein
LVEVPQKFGRWWSLRTNQVMQTTATTDDYHTLILI